MNPIELVAVVMTPIAIVLTIKERTICWPVAIVGILENSWLWIAVNVGYVILFFGIEDANVPTG